MERIEYNDSNARLRSEFPRIETPFGEMAYFKSLQFLDYGHTQLGGFEPPYDGQPGADRTITVNRVPYSGSITVYLRRDASMALDFSSLHPYNQYRETPSDAARRKLEAHFLPLAKELFQLPSMENIAAAIHNDVARNVKSAVSSYVHTLSSTVWHDARYNGFADVIKDGLKDGLTRAAEAVTKETFQSSPY